MCLSVIQSSLPDITEEEDGAAKAWFHLFPTLPLFKGLNVPGHMTPRSASETLFPDPSQDESGLHQLQTLQESVNILAPVVTVRLFPHYRVKMI